MATYKTDAGHPDTTFKVKQLMVSSTTDNLKLFDATPEIQGK